MARKHSRADLDYIYLTPEVARLLVVNTDRDGEFTLRGIPRNGIVGSSTGLDW